MFLRSLLILGRCTNCKAPFVTNLSHMEFLARVITLQFVCAVEDWFGSLHRLHRQS